MFPLVTVNVDSIHTWVVPVPLLPAVVAGQVTDSETFDPTCRVVWGIHADEPLLELLLDPLDPLPEEPVPLDEPAPLLLLPEIDPLELLLIDPLEPPEPDELPELPPEPEPLLDPPSSGAWT
jgi:hypothetical protein